MANCQCAKIAECESDIEILNVAKRALEGLTPRVTSINGYLQEMSESSINAYEADNITEIQEALKKLDDSIEPSINSWIAKIAADIETITAMLEKYKAEDEIYHRELEEYLSFKNKQADRM